jgi:DNA primase
MARIPENEIERLKKEISVERLAEARGIKLTRQDADLIGKCPFHDDRTPSLVITPAKNLWHCLGACGKGGDVIAWVMKANGISFRHAVELLRKDHLPLAAEPIKPVKVGTVRVLPAPVAADADDQALLSTIVGFYQDTLKQSPEAQRYLEGRGLKSAEMVQRFRLGFANRTLGYRLEAKNRAGGAAVRGRLQQLGIYRESGHEHFNGSLVIPVITAAGDVVRCTVGRSRQTCEQAHRIISICRVSIGACGMKKRSSRRKKSSSANRSSTHSRSGSLASAT